MHPRRLRHKNQRQRLINGRSIHIKAVPGRQYERHRLPRHAEQFHLLQRSRQSRFRTSGSKRNRQWLGDRVQKSLDRNSRQQRNRKQHAHHKKKQRRIHRPQQLEQRQHHSQPEVPDRVSHRPKHANRRRIHHQVRELEHRFRKASREVQHRAPLWLRHQDQRHRKQHAEHDHLQDLSFRHGFRDVLGEYVGDDLRRRVRHAADRLPCSRSGQAYAIARAAQVDGRQPDEHRQCRNYLEIQQRLKRQPPHFLQIRVPRNAHHQRPKKQWCNNHLDQPQKNRAKHLQLNRNARPVVPQLRARQQSNKNPARQRTPRSGIRRNQQNRRPAQNHRHQHRQRHHVPAHQQRCNHLHCRRNKHRPHKFVFHRPQVPFLIGRERYAGYATLSIPIHHRKVGQSPVSAFLGHVDRFRAPVIQAQFQETSPSGREESLFYASLTTQQSHVGFISAQLSASNTNKCLMFSESRRFLRKWPNAWITLIWEDPCGVASRRSAHLLAAGRVGDPPRQRAFNPNARDKLSQARRMPGPSLPAQNRYRPR